MSILPANSALTLEDDRGVHAMGPDESWREAWTFDFYDPDHKISGNCYGGVHPHQGVGDFLYFLFKDDVLVDEVLETNCNISPDIGEDRFSFARAAFAPREPFKTTDCYVNNCGKSVVDLRWEAVNPPYDWRDSNSAISSSGSHHFEHLGRYTGSVKIAGTEYEIKNAVGMRDRAWGWGKRSSILGWLWVTAIFADDLVMNSFQVHMGDGSEVLYGYIFRGEENVVLRRSHAVPRYHELGGHPLGLTFDVEDVNGTSLRATGESMTMYNESALERNKWGHHFWCYNKFEYEGKTGYGMANYHWRGLANRPGDWTLAAGD